MIKVVLFSVFSIFLTSCTDRELESVDTLYALDDFALRHVATVQGKGISLGELDYNLAFYNSDISLLDNEDKKKALDKIINNEILYQAALESGFMADPKLKNNIRDLVAYEYRKFLEHKVGEIVKITKAEVELYYEENIDSFTQPSMYRLAIYERRQDALKIHNYSLKQIASSAEYLSSDMGFGEYALDSDHSNTKNKGGRLSWMTEDTRVSGLPHEVLAAGVDLEVGEVSNIISSNGRNYLVRKIDSKPQKIMSLETIQAELTKKLVEEQRQRLYQKKLENIKSKTAIEIDESLLVASPGVDKSSAHALSPPDFPIQ